MKHLLFFFLALPAWTGSWTVERVQAAYPQLFKVKLSKGRINYIDPKPRARHELAAIFKGRDDFFSHLLFHTIGNSLRAEFYESRGLTKDLAYQRLRSHETFNRYFLALIHQHLVSREQTLEGYTPAAMLTVPLETVVRSAGQFLKPDLKHKGSGYRCIAIDFLADDEVTRNLLMESLCYSALKGLWKPGKTNTHPVMLTWEGYYQAALTSYGEGEAYGKAWLEASKKMTANKELRGLVEAEYQRLAPILPFRMNH